jgi:hypothetical protein
MVEYSSAWERSALEASALPQAVKDHLSAAEKAIPNARVELIRQEGRRARRNYTFFIARSSGPDPALYRFTLGAYDDLLTLDLASIAGGDAGYDGRLVGDPIYIVCTHARRDACCARNGLPIYDLMAERAHERVWQCTHLGGHRLGPNVVVLPRGLCYGRVAPDDVPAILDSERVHLDNFRGRSSYDPAAQAAETFLRERLADTAAGSLTLVDIEESGSDRWSVRFEMAGGAKDRRVRLELIAAGYGTYHNCGDEQPKDAKEFRLIDIE